MHGIEPRFDTNVPMQELFFHHGFPEPLYRRLIEEHAATYFELSPKEIKEFVEREVVNIVYENGGSFFIRENCGWKKERTSTSSLTKL